MGSQIIKDKYEKFIILCPNCLKNIPYFKIIPPFIFYWCKCFREDESNNKKKINEIFQWKKITYNNYIKAIGKVNYSNINVESLSEITNCEYHPNNKKIYVGNYSKNINCELCKNPGETNITLEKYLNELLEDINKELNTEIITKLENDKYLLCYIYKILIKELSKNKIINNNIIKSFKYLVDLIKTNNNNLKEISETIEKYISLDEDLNHINYLKETSLKIFPKIKINKEPKVLKMEQTLIDMQVYDKKIGNSIVYQILLFKGEKNINDKTKNYYTLIASILVGNNKRGPPTCSIYNFSLFPFEQKFIYENRSFSQRFYDSNLSLSKYGKDTFICAGSSKDFYPHDTILIYSINQQKPINIIEMRNKYILIKSFYNESKDISFLYLSQDQEDQNLPGGQESGHRYLYFYNKECSLIFNDTINNIFHEAKHFNDKTICVYIKNKNIIVIFFSLISYSVSNRSYLLFYNIKERKYNLLNNEYFTIITNEKILEPYILSIWSDDDYLYSLNSEKIIQKWDCIECTCIQKININLIIENNPKNECTLLNINKDMNKLVIINNGDNNYFIKDNEKNIFVEGTTIKLDDEKSKLSLCKIDEDEDEESNNNDNNNNNEYLLVIKNKNFFFVQNY